MELDISDTLAAKSDQINAVDLVEPVVVTITDVRKVSGDQPLRLKVQEFPGKEFRPAKTVRRILADPKVWGRDASQWVGKRVEIFNDPTVMFKGQQVGGVRVSAVSHIDRDVTVNVMMSNRKHEDIVIRALPQQAPQQPAQQAEAAVVDPEQEINDAIIRANGDPEKLDQLHAWAANKGAPPHVLDNILQAKGQTS